MADHFASGNIQWPTSLLMQIVRADVQACREIQMENFLEKVSQCNNLLFGYGDTHKGH
jgi:hypothetical protein